MNGRLVSVFGLGRSGLSVARAALAVGASPIVFDEGAGPADPGALRELESLGVKVVTHWDGRFADAAPDIVVTSPGVPRAHPKLQEAVADGLQVMGEVEFAYRIARAPILAVTGTNGKSTTVVMAHLCAEALGLRPILCGNIYGSGYEEVPLTEAAVAAEPQQLLVAEISSFQLEWVSQFRPKAAAITNITQDHLNRYASFEDYAAVKHRIFAAQTRSDVAVTHAEDPTTEPRSGSPRVWHYGLAAAEGQETATHLHAFGAQIAKSALPFIEPHNFRNGLTAALLCLACLPGNPEDRADEALQALRAFRGLRHRMERLGERDGVLVVNNSMCTNPAAVIAGSQSLPRRQHLLMGGVNKGMDFRPVGDYLRASGHSAYLYGKDGESTRAQMQVDVPVMATLAEAFERATQAAKSGEAILLSPGLASTDQFQDFRDRGETFRRLALEWLNS